MIKETTLCRLCNNSKLHYLFTANHYSIHRCLNCDFVQVGQQPSPSSIEKIYEQTYFSHNKYKDQNTLAKEHHRRVSLVHQYIASGSMILDAGCGIGDFLHAGKKHFVMHGFDISASGIDIAKSNNPDIAHQIWCGKLENQNLPLSSFDAICSWDVLEHIWDPIPTYFQLLDYLKPNGYLFLSTPNIGAPVARLLGKYWPFMTPPEHLSFFNKQSLKFLATRKLNANLVSWKSQGKWVNLGFILYKIKRVAPRSFLDFLVHAFERGSLSKLSVYVPTGDIQYCVIKKSTT